MSNEIAGLFQGINHSTQEKELIPVIEVSDIVDPEKHLMSYFGSDVEYIYFCPNSFPSFVYWKDFVWIDIWGTAPEMLDNLRVKEMIQQFTVRIDSFKANNDYESIFNLVDKKPLFMLFQKHFEDIPLKDRYDIFRNIYRRSEYGFQHVNQQMWDTLLSIREYSNEWEKSMEELHNRCNGNSQVTVYRGESSSSTPLTEAWSWTLSYKTAQFFATRFSSEGTIYETNVSIDDIADFLPYNGEEEVLIPPSRIVIINKISV